MTNMPPSFPLKLPPNEDDGQSPTTTTNNTTTTTIALTNKNNADLESPPSPPPNQDTSTEANGNNHVHNNGNNDDNDQDQKDYPHDRDPFFAFVPQLIGFGTGILGNELLIAKKAAVAAPSWTVGFIKDTFEFYKQDPHLFMSEVISGFTVAIMQIPESIAFSFIAGVPPLSGLHSTFWMALITGIFGGKPGMISGIAGALAVVLVDLSADDGVLTYLDKKQRLDVMFVTVFFSGVAQILFAWLRLGKLVRLIPETGMIGFMNGLAIIIFLAQLPAFMKCEEYPLFVDCKVDERRYLNFVHDTWVLILSLVHIAICMTIMKFYPRLPNIGKFPIKRVLPASLVSLLVGTLIEHTLFRRAFGVETRTVAQTAQLKGNLPEFYWPAIPNDSKTINTVITYALTLAAIGGVESVLTLEACNEITDTVPKVSDSNQELFAQGLGNLVCGMFGAVGGDAMIGQSTINIMNGARHRVSSTMSGIFMLLFVVLLSSFIELLPIPTLTGVLFMVVLSTFQWKTFVILRYGRLSDSATILIVTLIAVFFNLAIAILAGIVFSALVHSWDSGSHVSADIQMKKVLVDGEECKVKYVHVRGAIFFSSARRFVNMFSVSDDPEIVVIDLKDALVIDHSAVAAIQGITRRFEQVGKRVLLANVPHKSVGRLHRTGDHGVLRRQMTHGLVSGGVEERKNVVDEATVGNVYGHLPMFDVPTENIDQQLSQLEIDQGSVVADVKKEK